MGICLGLQLLFSNTVEFGQYEGLNIIPGTVAKFPTTNSENKKVKVPQVGWNSVFHSAKNDSWQPTDFQTVTALLKQKIAISFSAFDIFRMLALWSLMISVKLLYVLSLRPSNRQLAELLATQVARTMHGLEF